MTGANWAFRQILSRRGLLILCYHGVVAEDHADEPFFYRNTVSVRQFRKQLEFLNRHFRPISISDLIDHVRHGAKLRPGSVLLTFDDGYRNNLVNAAPLLQRYSTPALFSITTGYIGKTNLLWPDEVNVRILKWPTPCLPYPRATSEPGDRSTKAAFASVPIPPERAARIRLAEQIRSQCKRLSDDLRQAYLNELRQQHSAALEDIDRELYDFLSWDEVRSLARLGFEIGSHTVTHPILTQVGSQELAWELTNSKACIEAHVGRSCRCIVYPNGQATDYSPEVEQSACTAGYHLGFLATGWYSAPAGGLYRLDRIGVPGQQSHAVFESRVSGIHTWVKRHL